MSMEERGSTKKVWAHRKAGWTKTREMWDIAFLRYFVKSLNLWKFISDDKRLWVICIQTGVHQLADHIIEGRKPYIRCFIENLKKVSPPIHWGGNHTSDILLRINKSFIFNTLREKPCIGYFIENLKKFHPKTLWTYSSMCAYKWRRCPEKSKRKC